MAQVLLLGYEPETVDYSDPALPPGMTVEKGHAGIAVAMRQFAEHGWEADVGLIRPDETAGPSVERQLALKSYDCVVIGAGVTVQSVTPAKSWLLGSWPSAWPSGEFLTGGSLKMKRPSGHVILESRLGSGASTQSQDSSA